MQAILIADLADLLSRIQDLVLRLGRGDDSETLHELGRCYHTLKGASGSVGLTTLAAPHPRTGRRDRGCGRLYRRTSGRSTG
ncbi:Hpt domain-containing protein, partial [Bremerella sp. JC817]|uniref:Hpt domain-containing protein n=1 Tax=Bremerella sp. JC817 TaxID=3231756 RepID=UPI003458D25D